jgi:nucleoside-diphosphate-sugar epimerase
LKILVTGASGFIGRNLAEHFRPVHDVAAPSRAELDLLDDAAVGSTSSATASMRSFTRPPNAPIARSKAEPSF